MNTLTPSPSQQSSLRSRHNLVDQIRQEYEWMIDNCRPQAWLKLCYTLPPDWFTDVESSQLGFTNSKIRADAIAHNKKIYQRHVPNTRLPSNAQLLGTGQKHETVESRVRRLNTSNDLGNTTNQSSRSVATSQLVHSWLKIPSLYLDQDFFGHNSN